MRSDVLTQLHESHQGSVRTKQMARLTIYWQIMMLFHRAGNARITYPREPKSRPARPFQELAIDLHNFYTDWHDIIHMGHDTIDSLP